MSAMAELVICATGDLPPRLEVAVGDAGRLPATNWSNHVTRECFERGEPPWEIDAAKLSSKAAERFAGRSMAYLDMEPPTSPPNLPSFDAAAAEFYSACHDVAACAAPWCQLSVYHQLHRVPRERWPEILSGTHAWFPVASISAYLNDRSPDHSERLARGLAEAVRLIDDLRSFYPYRRLLAFIWARWMKARPAPPSREFMPIHLWREAVIELGSRADVLGFFWRPVEDGQDADAEYAEYWREASEALT